MQNIGRGQKIPLALPTPFTVEVTCAGLAADICCFGVDAAGRLSDDRYMVFYNQTSSPEGAITLDPSGVFHVDPGRLPATVHRLVFTATVDGEGSMSALGPSHARFGESLLFGFSGADFDKEKAVIVAEIYRREGAWRLAAVGQGFSGGLPALLAHFGGEEAKEVKDAKEHARPSLEKRVEREAPHLVSLTKKAQVSLEKAGLGGHRARCALCLDISASMDTLYARGKVQALADRVMALSTRLDDDGELDVFLFGEKGHQPKPMGLAGCSEYVRELLREHPLEGGTRYHTAMKLIREHYFGGSGERKAPHPQPLPVYVMFVTDGGTSNRETAVAQVRWSSFEPIFWQFMAIGRSGFGFLERLDDLDGRLLDNAGFFSVDDPAALSDDALYAKMMDEYPGWVRKAKEKGLIR